MTGRITDILPSAYAVLGLAGADRLDLAERVGGARRIVLVLVDGLGYHLLPRAAESSGFLADVHAGRIGHLDRLECTLPSTTPTSLVSLGTGVLPGEHGILGFTLNIPGTDRLLTHILWRDDPPPERWQPVPTVFTLGSAAGIGSSVVLPAMFAGSGLTRAAYGSADFIGLTKGDDQVDAIVRALHNGSSFVFGYTAAVDTAAHAHGIASEKWAAAAAYAGQLLERLVAALPADTALLVTADHGGLDVPPTARVDIGADAQLTAGVRVVAGEPRFRYLHTEPGATDDVCAAWQAMLGTTADVLTREEAVASGLFGSMRPEHLPRIGDVVVISTGDSAVLATGYEPPEVAKLVGFHGARTPEETAIPLITFAADKRIA
jgi:hypothetical protein